MSLRLRTLTLNKNLRRLAFVIVLASMLMLLNPDQLFQHALQNETKARKLEINDEEENHLYHQRPIMHTFYDPLTQDKQPQYRQTGMTLSDDRRLLETWTASWESMGWQVRILTMEDAQNHPDFGHIQELLGKIPLGRRPNYDRVCYLRWFAMSAVGGGWMSDYDVIPLPGSMLDKEKSNEANMLPEDGKFTVYDMTAQKDPVPSLMSGSGSEWERVSNLILENGVEKGSEENYMSDFRNLIDLKNTADIVQRDEVVKGHNILTEQLTLTTQDCIDMKGKRAIHISHRAMKELKRKIYERPFVAAKFWDSLVACSEKESDS